MGNKCYSAILLLKVKIHHSHWFESRLPWFPATIIMTSHRSCKMILYPFHEFRKLFQFSFNVNNFQDSKYGCLFANVLKVVFESPIRELCLLSETLQPSDISQSSDFNLNKYYIWAPDQFIESSICSLTCLSYNWNLNGLSVWALYFLPISSTGVTQGHIIYFLYSISFSYEQTKMCLVFWLILNLGARPNIFSWLLSGNFSGDFLCILSNYESSLIVFDIASFIYNYYFLEIFCYFSFEQYKMSLSVFAIAGFIFIVLLRFSDNILKSFC